MISRFIPLNLRHLRGRDIDREWDTSIPKILHFCPFFTCVEWLRSRENKSLLHFKSLNTAILMRNIKLLFPYFIITSNAPSTFVFLLWLFHFRPLPLSSLQLFQFQCSFIWMLIKWRDILDFSFLQCLKISVQCWRPRLLYSLNIYS